MASSEAPAKKRVELTTVEKKDEIAVSPLLKTILIAFSLLIPILYRLHLKRSS